MTALALAMMQNIFKSCCSRIRPSQSRGLVREPENNVENFGNILQANNVKTTSLTGPKSLKLAPKWGKYSLKEHGSLEFE